MPTPVSSPDAPAARPALFAAPSQLLGWQGLTLNLPEAWNLATFGGDWDKGHLRADDEDGPRLEIRWETPVKSVDLPRSVSDFLNTLARHAKREKRAFESLPDARVLSPKRKRKAQLASFGWKGEADETGASQGFGVAWECAECGRVVLAHLLGRANERSGKTQALASEILQGLECHGAGGWATWSVFGLQLDVPEEFRLSRSKLQTGRLELSWVKPPAPGLLMALRRPERLGVVRLSAANVLLENEDLESWTARALGRADKARRFGPPVSCEVRGHPAMRIEGRARDVRQRLRFGLGDWLRRDRTPPAAITAWHCPPSNKLFALDCEVARVNAHLPGDVLDSLCCH